MEALSEGAKSRPTNSIGKTINDLSSQLGALVDLVPDKTKQEYKDAVGLRSNCNSDGRAGTGGRSQNRGGHRPDSPGYLRNGESGGDGGRLTHSTVASVQRRRGR
jgi:hypothetical protein